MIERIIFSTLALVFFVYMFVFKVVKKNDLTYFIIMGLQAIGIAINFLQIIYKIMNIDIWNYLRYILSIVIPIAITVFEEYGGSFTEHVYILTSKFLIMLGKNKQAKNLIVNLLKKDNEIYSAHLMLAQLYEKSGGNRRAVDEYVKCIDLNKNDYNSYFKIAQLLNETNRKEEVIKMLKKLIEIKPDFYRARVLLGEVLYEKGEYKQAIDCYLNILKKNDDNWEAYYNLGLAYVKTNNFNNAKGCFEEATRINGDLYEAYYKLAQIALLYCEFDVAETYFLNSICDRTESRASFELAKIYMIKNDKNKAGRFLRKSIEIDKNMYEKAKLEPMFLLIKDSMKQLDENRPEFIDTRTEKEREIEDYLSNTYLITKELGKQEKQQKQIRKFKWQQ